MKDIGSIFPLYNKDIQAHSIDKRFPNRIQFSLCREALLSVAEQLDNTNKIVLMPSYTCDTVYMPFKQLGWKCIYYSINRNLVANANSIVKEFETNHPALVIFHPYLGRGLSGQEKECIKKIHNSGSKVLVDNTQCIFSEERLEDVDYYAGSYRKWFPIPDGGFLESKNSYIIQPEDDNVIFNSLQKGAMYLRGEYFLTENEDIKQLSIQLNKAADLHSVGTIVKHRMSEFSESILYEQNFKECIYSRYTNYKYLLENLKQDHITFAIDSMDAIASAPLYFTFYLEDRKSLQAHLAKHHIYLPVIWPVDDEEVLIDEEVKYIYDHVLCIPVDQRYDLQDMQKVVTLINEFYD